MRYFVVSVSKKSDLLLFEGPFEVCSERSYELSPICTGNELLVYVSDSCIAIACMPQAGSISCMARNVGVCC